MGSYRDIETNSVEFLAVGPHNPVALNGWQKILCAAKDNGKRRGGQTHPHAAQPRHGLPNRLFRFAAVSHQQNCSPAVFPLYCSTS